MRRFREAKGNLLNSLACLKANGKWLFQTHFKHFNLYSQASHASSSKNGKCLSVLLVSTLTKERSHGHSWELQSALAMRTCLTMWWQWKDKISQALNTPPRQMLLSPPPSEEIETQKRKVNCLRRLLSGNMGPNPVLSEDSRNMCCGQDSADSFISTQVGFFQCS